MDLKRKEKKMKDHVTWFLFEWDKGESNGILEKSFVLKTGLTGWVQVWCRVSLLSHVK